MSESLLIAIITGLITASASVLSAVIANAKSRAVLEKELAYQQKQIDELKKDVKEHNNYAHEIPLMNERLEHLKEDMTHVRNIVEKR